MHVIVFSTQTNMNFFFNQQRLLMDGPFYYCTKFFLQLFTISVNVNDNYISSVFCLLKNNNKSTSKTLFKLLKIKCSELGLELSSRKCMWALSKQGTGMSKKYFPFPLS